MHDGDGLCVILEYLHSLCNHDRDAIAFLLDWARRMARHPEVRDGRALLLRGAPGCGKSFFATLLRVLTDKVYHTRTGGLHRNNNMQLACALVVVCRDMNWIDDDDRAGFRSLLTDPQMMYRRIGPVNSYQRVLMINTSDAFIADRRVYPIQCGVEHVGDTAYFERLYQTLNNHDTLCTFWSYLMGLSLWGRVRTRLRIRAIVLYWLGLTENLMEEGGVAYERDRAEAKSLGFVGD
eukprot:7013021-Prymnesium_polylepis.1